MATAHELESQLKALPLADSIERVDELIEDLVKGLREAGLTELE